MKVLIEQTIAINWLLFCYDQVPKLPWRRQRPRNATTFPLAHSPAISFPELGGISHLISEAPYLHCLFPHTLPSNHNTDCVSALEDLCSFPSLSFYMPALSFSMNIPSFHILSTSLFINHPLIWCCLVSVTESIIK
jgi:hypothetical protein